MLAKNVTIGSMYRCKVGQRLALVKVISDRGCSGRRFSCLTQDTNRMIRASAAKLRPLAGTPEAAAERTRKLAAEARRMKAPAKVTPPPADAPRLVAPAPVPGMVRRVDPSRLVEPLIGHNRERVEHIVAGVDVALPWSMACRAVYRQIGLGGRLRGFSRHLRRGAWLKVAEEHAANRRLYLETMGHAPVPSTETIEAAMAGDQLARAAVLAQ